MTKGNRAIFFYLTYIAVLDSKDFVISPKRVFIRPWIKFYLICKSNSLGLTESGYLNASFKCITSSGIYLKSQCHLPHRKCIFHFYIKSCIKQLESY